MIVEIFKIIFLFFFYCNNIKFENNENVREKLRLILLGYCQIKFESREREKKVKGGEKEEF